MKATVVPNRNALFSSLLYGTALSIASTHNTNAEVVLGVHSGDHAIYPDCRPEFYRALEHAFALVTGKVNEFRSHYRILMQTRRRFYAMRRSPLRSSGLILTMSSLAPSRPTLLMKKGGQTGRQDRTLSEYWRSMQSDERIPWSMLNLGRMSSVLLLKLSETISKHSTESD